MNSLNFPKIARLRGLALAASFVAALAFSPSAEAADNIDPKAFEAALEKVRAFEQSLGLGIGDELKPNEPAIREFFASLETPEEKLAFIDMTHNRYVYAIDRDLAIELLAKLLDEPQLEIRVQAAQSLGYNGGSGTVPPEKIIALFETGDPKAQEAALYAMGFSGEAGKEAFAPKLLECLRSDDPKLQAKTCFYLVRLTGAEHAEDIAALLDDSEVIVRAFAVQALGLTKAKKFAPRVAAMLEDESLHVREPALKALVMLEATEQAEAIAARLNDKHDWIRALAAQSLGELGAEAYADKVAQLLDGESTGARRLAVEALGKIGGERHREAISAHLEDEDKQTHERAKEALRVLDRRLNASD